MRSKIRVQKKKKVKVSTGAFMGRESGVRDGGVLFCT
jgi:hypothetical protein